MRNWWGNPCISHMMKYIKRWESNGKKAPILWEKYNYRFPRLSPYHGFCYIFPYWGKFMGKPMHFPYAEYIIGWESDGKKALILWKKYDYQFPRLSPYHGFCCIFLYFGKFTGKPIHSPYAEVYHRIVIGWEKSIHTIGKVWVSISQTFSIPLVLLNFPVLWKTYRETHALFICWHRLLFPVRESTNF